MAFNYTKATDGNLVLKITNEADEKLSEEAFGYSDLNFIQCQKDQNYDPINKKCCHKSCDPVSCTGPMLWQCNIILDNNCTPKAALKYC